MTLPAKPDETIPEPTPSEAEDQEPVETGIVELELASKESVAVLIALVALLLFRIFVVFKKIGCIHCAAKRECPNAKSMGIP